MQAVPTSLRAQPFAACCSQRQRPAAGRPAALRIQCSGEGLRERAGKAAAAVALSFALAAGGERARAPLPPPPLHASLRPHCA